MSISTLELSEFAWYAQMTFFTIKPFILCILHIVSFVVNLAPESKVSLHTSNFSPDLKTGDIKSLFHVTSVSKYKNMHVKTFHEEKKDDMFKYGKCNESFTTRTNLLYHTQKHHEEQSL